MNNDVIQKYKSRVITNAILTLGVFIAPLIMLMSGKDVKHIWFNIVAYVVINGILAIVFWKYKNNLW